MKSGNLIKQTMTQSQSLQLIKTDAVIAVDLQWLGQIDAIPVVK
jgi:hypothetical protein